MTNKIAIGVNSQGGYNWIDSSDLVGQDLSNLKFVVLLTCWNGYGGYSPSRVANGNPANMMERLLVCGAETVLAFSDEAPRGECNRFASYLAKYMIEDGLTVQQAINQIAANNGTINVGTLLNIYVIGGNASKKIDW